ncbi:MULTISPECIES: LacI family DNA-binding transcriptional regulator [Brevibacillus]|uniref:LacI family DNA-binding transcriptional regulator n=1 Tax=Brevibacillus TaxID=55080 RepID=UPI000EC9163E|nr:MULTISPECIES: LacI family DNA-binding transcriptional regulator [Brevibacillus]MBU8714587.1 substrate-binding domain-containing protein [Brevibacillus parabrevis]MDR4998569.1 LacI family DNA-binding transcriptional regulator [Brevibacillus parabrevis]MED2254702.1 LacI family DNA-binding transcriptional regulator [Brevibacillus parabrevis]NRQ54262.1 LacI family DNA-binding transcriptional regulator [Brevibacillus sp. HD1.4A]UED67796.1 LacI family transcriptional regulator [Brevibacillus sp. 
MAITIKDIAKRANVSTATVSRVINNKSEGISPQTREYIQSIIKELNYQPNALARGLITRKTSTIGLILPDITNPFFPDLVRGIEDAANKAGYSVFLGNSDDNAKKEKKYVQLMTEKKVDGIIFSSTAKYSKDLYDELIAADIPVVLIDRGESGDAYSGVYMKNEEGAYMATKHLLEQNHTRIGCISGPPSVQNSQDRVEGYKRALAEAGISVQESWIVSGGYRIDGGYEVAKKMLADGEVTAIFACNDLMAIGVYEAAQELGKSIPRDVSVVGFDDIRLISTLMPKLTTIRQPAYQMGKEAAKILIQSIKKKGIKQKVVYWEPELMIRQSTTKL